MGSRFAPSCRYGPGWNPAEHVLLPWLVRSLSQTGRGIGTAFRTRFWSLLKMISAPRISLKNAFNLLVVRPCNLVELASQQN